MKQDDKLRERIESYLNGDLSQADAASFETEINADPELKALVQDYRDAEKLVDLYHRIELKKELQALSNELGPVSFEEKKLERAKTRTLLFEAHWIKAAAAVLVIFIIAYLYSYLNYNDAAIYEEAFEPHSVRGFSYRSNSDKELSTLEKGIKAYDDAAYHQAIDILQTLPDSVSRYYEARIYLGNAYMATDEFGQAIRVFREDQENQDFKWRRNWYLAMAYLANHQPDSTQKILINIIEKSNERIYRAQADKVLKKMNHSLRILPGVG